MTVEDIPESFKQRFRAGNQRRVPFNRRNKFTNRFIPKVKPVGQLDNLSSKTVFDADSDQRWAGGRPNLDLSKQSLSRST